MHCTNCGAQLPDGSVFCTNCGAQMAEEEAKTFCTNCGSTVSANASACPTCGQALTPPAPAKEPVDKKKLITLAGLAVGAIAVVVLLIVLISSLFGGKTPQDGLEKLIDKGNFTIEYEDTVIMVDMDVKKQELTVYCEEDGEFSFAIYDEMYIGYYSYYDEYYYYDYSDSIEQFFEAYGNYDDADWEELAELISDMTGEDVEDYVNIKQFEKAMNTFEKNLENKSWLKKNAGYSTETKSGVKYHIYEPNLYTFAVASLETFEKAFEDDDLYDDAMDFLKDYKSTLKNVDVTIKLGVKGGYLVSAEVKASGQKIKVKVVDIGSTKIDTGDIEDILDDAEEW